MYILDTDICIYLIKKRPSILIDRLRACFIGEVGISSVSVGELQFGVEKSTQPERNQNALDQFLLPLEIPAYGHDAARMFGRVRAKLERRGTPIGAYDMMIAAHALALDATLVTNNTREFKRVSGLNCENWTRK